ncbi:sulfur oxidation c-type cytochrome SoxA [Massilia sp. P8910]|uniref:sulfur oxidation c-type cytochrome SoxA n=1 Tax=Massilia antarctica TaxID=2765360 RepID=UPI001E30C6E8|nr:sulfur oxidation c-type cytochrome SoxA [Massilia antarctica]MCE3604278.1 sulfur oxidation c-type cytochrome SoxA [Massilia antarctica]
MINRRTLVLSAGLLATTGTALAQTSATDEIAKYRQMLADGNPAELWEMRGEELWKTKTGPNKVSLEQCDFGKGPGVLKGAYTELPRYFKDVNKVMDLEQRLVHCRITLQGLTPAEAVKTPFGAAGKKSDIEALVSYITAESRGMKMAVSTDHPLERRAYETGRQLFFYRGGSHDFACATCHSADGQRIRLQELPNILNPANAQAAYTTWPAYRVSQGEVRTMQHRLTDCFRQQRFPEPLYASDALTAVTMFLAKNANGGVYAGPALKR